MPATRTKTKTEPAGAPPKRRGRPPQKPTPPVFVEPAEPAPAAAAPAAEAAEEAPEFGPRLVDGDEVVKDEPLRSPLRHTHADGSPIMFRGYRLLTLASGRQVIGCALCPDVTGTRGEVQKHRVEVHGMGQAGRRTRTVAEEQQARQEQDRRVQAMTLGELLTLARHVDDWETLFDAQAVQLDTQAAELAELRRWKLKMERALDRIGFKPKLDDEE